MNFDILQIAASAVDLNVRLLIVAIGAHVVFGALRASIRDNDFSLVELGKFARETFFTPAYGSIVGLLVASALAPTVDAQQALVAGLSGTAFALAVGELRKAVADAASVAGFADAHWLVGKPAAAPVVPKAA